MGKVYGEVTKIKCARSSQRGLTNGVSSADVKIHPAGENCNSTWSTQDGSSLLYPFLQEMRLPLHAVQQIVTVERGYATSLYVGID